MNVDNNVYHTQSTVAYSFMLSIVVDKDAWVICTAVLNDNLSASFSRIKLDKWAATFDASLYICCCSEAVCSKALDEVLFVAIVSVSFPSNAD